MRWHEHEHRQRTLFDYDSPYTQHLPLKKY